ncbi:hypothetical protein TRVL_06141 [Trypanosoma vivax]|nr:hypothetical protein TRVL_06141 [Trypanosoma vivax]
MHASPVEECSVPWAVTGAMQTVRWSSCTEWCYGRMARTTAYSPCAPVFGWTRGVDDWDEPYLLLKSKQWVAVGARLFSGCQGSKVGELGPRQGHHGCSGIQLHSLRAERDATARRAVVLPP